MTPHGAPVEATSNRPYRTRPLLGPLGAAACVVALASALMAGPAAALLTPDTSATHVERQTPPKGPPNVRLSTGSVNLALHPYSSCWSTGHSGMCYDGMPPRPLPSVGGTDGPIGLAFARDRWRFRVSVTDEEGTEATSTSSEPARATGGSPWARFPTVATGPTCSDTDRRATSLPPSPSRSTEGHSDRLPKL